MFFLPLLLNIGLYTYTLRYKPDIKIPGFLRNVFKKNPKNNFQKILNILN
jgi:hypothetical protein